MGCYYRALIPTRRALLGAYGYWLAATSGGAPCLYRPLPKVTGIGGFRRRRIQLEFVQKQRLNRKMGVEMHVRGVRLVVAGVAMGVDVGVALLPTISTKRPPQSSPPPVSGGARFWGCGRTEFEFWTNLEHGRDK